MGKPHALQMVSLSAACSNTYSARLQFGAMRCVQKGVYGSTFVRWMNQGRGWYSFAERGHCGTSLEPPKPSSHVIELSWMAMWVISVIGAGLMPLLLPGVKPHAIPRRISSIRPPLAQSDPSVKVHSLATRHSDCSNSCRRWCVRGRLLLDMSHGVGGRPARRRQFDGTRELKPPGSQLSAPKVRVNVSPLTSPRRVLPAGRHGIAMERDKRIGTES